MKFGKPILAGNLQGHNSGVLDLVFHNKRDVLFSLDSHSIVLVWDLASRTMVAKLTPLSQNPFDITHKVTRLLVAGPNRHLVTATNHPRMWKVKPLDLRDESEKLVIHSAEVLATLYNTNFDHLLTVDRAGFVAIWAVGTGVQIFKFICESVQEFFGVPDVTAASFDLSERRLVVGWNQGSIQLYNFSNGTLLHNLLTETSSPVVSVTQIEYSRGNDFHRHFVAALEDGVILQWPNKMKQRDAPPVRKIEVPNWMGTEFVDVPITCIAFGKPHTLVAGRKDGKVLEWDMQTGFLMKNEHGPIVMQCTETNTIAVQAARFLHKMESICLVADGEGNVHFIDSDGGHKLGSIRGKKRNVGYSDIQSLEVDQTDSFLFAGESSGWLQMWDVSQVFDQDLHFHRELCVDVMRWKAHEAAVTRIVHMSKYNLVLTASNEPDGNAAVWSVVGEKLGVLGHSRWTMDDIERVLHAVPAPAADDEKEHKDGWGQEKGSRGLELLGSKMVGMTSLRRVLGSVESRTQSVESVQWEDDKVRGQLTLTIRSLSNLPNHDRNSKSDPYAILTITGHKQRRTRVIENQNTCRVEEEFLYFIEGMDRSVQIEVWDHDHGGDHLHDFIGQVVIRLESLLLMANAEEGVVLKLMRKDGKTTLKDGSITIAAKFTPIVSELQHRSKPRSVQEHIKLALIGSQQVAPVPPLRPLALAGQGRSAVTALATARWDSVDFRNLSVYQLQDDARISGFATERLDRKGKGRSHVDERGQLHPLPRRHGGESHRHLPVGTVEHRFSKDTLAGRLERSLDSTFAETYGKSGLHVMEANASLMRASRVEPLAKKETPNLKAIGDAIRVVTNERKKLEVGGVDFQNEKKRFYRRSSLVTSESAMPAAYEHLAAAKERREAEMGLVARKPSSLAQVPPKLPSDAMQGGPRRKAVTVAAGGGGDRDAGGVSLPKII